MLIRRGGRAPKVPGRRGADGVRRLLGDHTRPCAWEAVSGPLCLVVFSRPSSCRGTPGGGAACAADPRSDVGEKGALALTRRRLEQLSPTMTTGIFISATRGLTDPTMAARARVEVIWMQTQSILYFQIQRIHLCRSMSTQPGIAGSDGWPASQASAAVMEVMVTRRISARQIASR